MVVPGLEEISSDDDTDDDIKFLDESSRNIQHYETISIDGDSMSEGDDDSDDIVIISIEDKRKRRNQVWRNIVECDLLDQSVKKMGLAKFRVNRDVESYDLPSYKLRRFRKPQRHSVSRSRGRDVRQRLGRVRMKVPMIESNVIQISSSSDDESETYCNKKEKKREKIEPIIIEDDEDEKSPPEIHDLVSDSDDSEEDESQANTWNKLIKNLDENQFQIEFESGREAAARKIAKELQESKIDLIDRCLIYLGLEKCQTFLTATKRIESNGGMPTKDGSRRRTPGGVFLTLIKSDRTIERSIKEQIFLDSEETTNNENESLWWKSVEINQYRRNRDTNDRRTVNFRRKKEFKSYTLIDLDYFECFKDFRYRYIPMVSCFPPAASSGSSRGGEEDDENDDDGVIVSSGVGGGGHHDDDDMDVVEVVAEDDLQFQMDIYEIGDL